MNLVFAGDLCPFDSFDVSFSGSLRDVFAEVDYSFVNLECPLTDSANAILKCGPNLKASPRQFFVIKDIGANCVTLANNHILDYGEQGVIDTMELCRNNGIRYVGVGRTLDTARIPLVLEKDGINVAIINVTEREFSIAGDNAPGANPLDLINVMQDLEIAREKSDKIVFVVHGGLELVPCPSPESLRMLRFLAEQKNVIAVIRHHPHIIQGMEVWKGVPIYYSLGNFYFPVGRTVADGWLNGAVVKLEVSRDKVRWETRCVTVVKTANNTFYVDLDERRKFPEVDNDIVREIWSKEFAMRKIAYLNNTMLPYDIIMRVASKLHLLSIFPPSKRCCLAFQNYVRCDAHREVLERALD